MMVNYLLFCLNSINVGLFVFFHSNGWIICCFKKSFCWL